VHIEYAIDILDGDLVRVSLMPGLPGEDSEWGSEVQEQKGREYLLLFFKFVKYLHYTGEETGSEKLSNITEATISKSQQSNSNLSFSHCNSGMESGAAQPLRPEIQICSMMAVQWKWLFIGCCNIHTQTGQCVCEVNADSCSCGVVSWVEAARGDSRGAIGRWVTDCNSIFK
jgi:hypothetical protein